MKARTKYNFTDQLITLIIIEVVLIVSMILIHFQFTSEVREIAYEHPEWRIALPLTLILSVFYLISIYIKNKRLKRLADPELIGALTTDISSTRSLLKFILFRFAVLSIILGIINPKFGTKLEVAKAEGQDIFVCLDVSNSMLAEDIVPNRLDRAKMSLEQLIKNLAGDRIGIVIFAGDADVVLPLTTDYEAAKMFMKGIDTKLIASQGTSIGLAVDLAMESFNWKSKRSKSIIVITDGENHEESAIAAAKRASAKEVIVHAIGMGTTKGGPIPVFNKSGYKTGFKKDKQGNTVVSVLDENMLLNLVKEGNGMFVRANSDNVGLVSLKQKLDEADKEELDSFQYAEYQHSFQYFFGFALFLFILEFLISPKRNSWSKDLSLFD